MTPEEFADLLRRAAHMLAAPGNYSYAELDATAAALREQAAKLSPSQCALCPEPAVAGYSGQEPLCEKCWTEKALSHGG